MIKFVSLLGLCSLFISLLFFTPVVNAANGVYISELNYNGSSLNGGDKWVELYNPTSSSLVLDGWRLNMPNSSKTGTVALSGSIAPYSTYLVGTKNAKFSSLMSIPNITNYNITNVSNTTAGESNYINVELINSVGVTVSSVQKDDQFVKSIGISGKGDVKRSLECDDQAICSISTTQYAATGLDYGTPGKVFTPASIAEEKPVDQPVSAPIISDISLTPSPQIPSLQPQIIQEQTQTAKVNIPDPVSLPVTAIAKEATVSKASYTQISPSPVLSTASLPAANVDISVPLLNIQRPVIDSVTLPQFTLEKIATADALQKSRLQITIDGQLMLFVLLTSVKIVVDARDTVTMFTRSLDKI